MKYAEYSNKVMQEKLFSCEYTQFKMSVCPSGPLKYSKTLILQPRNSHFLRKKNIFHNEQMDRKSELKINLHTRQRNFLRE